MNSDMLRTPFTNGYYPSNVASSSTNPYPNSFTNANQRTCPSNVQGNHQMHSTQQGDQSSWHPQLQQIPANFFHMNRSLQPNMDGWPNQMQHCSYPNPVQAMTSFNLPFIPQQVIHDALAMSTPVEAGDESTLIQALLASRNNGENYKDALNSLHGKNGHSASLWKDYYLEHKDRLDSWIAMCLNADASRIATTKKPMVAKPALKREPSLSPPVKKSPTPLSLKQKQKEKKERKSTTPRASQPPATVGRRSTINSMTAPAPVYGDRLPAPNAEIRAPPPPSRSPSPPWRIVPHKGKGNKYTPEDREFFLKFIAWRLKGDPNLSRTDLCNQLAEKAPHHTAQSWASYWSNHHDVPDKILAAAHGEAYGSAEEEDDDDDRDVTELPKRNSDLGFRKRPKYYESSLSSEGGDGTTTDEEEESDDDNEDEDEGEDEDEDEEDEEPVQEYNDSQMGHKGGPFNNADLYITARYVASFADFDSVSSRERWDPYHEQHPQRSAKAWTEYYRRNERDIRRLAKKIRGQQRCNTIVVESQRGRPSWANGKMRTKRKHMEGGGEVTEGGKRSRG